MEIQLRFCGVEIELKGLRGLLTLAGLGLLACAIARELSLPPAERTWHGQLWGVVPYDLRPPTADRLRVALWDPQVDTILTEHPFGVGWAVNFGALVRRTLALTERPAGQAN